MLYLPDKVFALHSGTGYFFLFHDKLGRPILLETNTQDDSYPQMCIYKNDSQWQPAIEALASVAVEEENRHDYRINWLDNGDIAVLARNHVPSEI